MTAPARAAGVTPEELTNLATFSTEAARARYLTYGLTPREEGLVHRYFTMTGARLLDLGCGYGRTTVPLARMGYRVTALDIVPRMIGEARQAHPEIEWTLMSATDLAFPDASVDYAFFSANGVDCIYPETRRTDALREIHRVLRPGGVLLYSAHNWLAHLVTSLKQAPRRRIVLANAVCGRVMPGYLRVPQAGSELVIYFGTPRREVRALRAIGFRNVEVHSGKISRRLERFGRLGTAIFDVWPHYTAQR